MKKPEGKRRTVRLGRRSPDDKGDRHRVYGFTVHDIAGAVTDRRIEPRSVSALISHRKLDATDLGALVDWLAERRGWVSKGDVVPAVLQLVEGFPRYVNGVLRTRGLGLPALDGPAVLPPLTIDLPKP